MRVGSPSTAAAFRSQNNRGRFSVAGPPPFLSEKGTAVQARRFTAALQPPNTGLADGLNSLAQKERREFYA